MRTKKKDGQVLLCTLNIFIRNECVELKSRHNWKNTWVTDWGLAFQTRTRAACSRRALHPDVATPARPLFWGGSGLATKPRGKRTCSEHQEGKNPALRHRFRFRWDHKEGPLVPALCRVAAQTKWSWCTVNPVRGQMDSCLLPANFKPVQERPSLHCR